MKQKRSPELKIFYVLALPDWKPSEVTPFQGFAPKLPSFVPFMEFIPTLPADIVDPVMELDDKLARRRAGDGAWLWTPVNLSTLLRKRKPTPDFPYMVIFTIDQQSARAVVEWRKGLRLKPIHISFHKAGGSLLPHDLSQEVLRNHLIAIARKAAEIDKSINIDEHMELLNRWMAPQPRPSSIKLHSHNVTMPNEMALIGSGEVAPQGEDGHLQSSPHEQYVAGISQSADAVMRLWPQTTDRPIYLLSPPRPDIFLIAPSTYKGIVKRIERLLPDPSLKSAMRSLDRQRGYTIDLRHDGETDEFIDKIGPIFAIRGAEMKLTSAAVGLRAAGTIAATIRLPPAVNRTGGVVGQLARFLRKHENPPSIKSARVFKAVQDALIEYIPDEHLNLIAASQTGIKIIADAPLEWLPIDGLPLGIKYDVSRINSTPGNLFLEQIRPPIPLMIPPEAFRNYLVLSMFEDGDQIAPYLRVGALNTRDEEAKPIIGGFSSPKSYAEFASAINNFNGPLLIIDSHAEHLDGDVPGGLIIGGKPFDVWSLAGKVQMPPIVVLSACDTHPFDRNHATVANGFLACGAVAVIATSLPIRAPQAARFVMRLINRAVHYGALMNGMGRAIAWTHIVSGLLRMELATDLIRTFRSKDYFNDEVMSEIMLQTNLQLNPLDPSWYEGLLERLLKACNPAPQDFDRDVADVIAASDAIRYLHMGNPEAIILADQNVAINALKNTGIGEV